MYTVARPKVAVEVVSTHGLTYLSIKWAFCTKKNSPSYLRIKSLPRMKIWKLIGKIFTTAFFRPDQGIVFPSVNYIRYDDTT